MLFNPFTPSEIASAPGEFFGRDEELRTFERSLAQGCVAIDGAIGIGKSSLMTHGLLMMEGFNSDHNATSFIAVADKGVVNIDAAARLVLETFVHVDQTENKIAFKAAGFEIESKEICSYFRENRHLAALKRMVEREYLERLTNGREMLILAIDEADKAPVALAQLVRSLVTHTQHHHIKNVRFVLAGVRPFLQQMVAEDSGIQRFIYKTITLRPMRLLEARELVEAKLIDVVSKAEESGEPVRVSNTIIQRLAILSGGHPHILQLLGSHLVEHENDDPDGVLDSRDLLNSFRRVCYEDRANVYEAMLHNLELHGRLDTLRALLGLTPESPRRIVSQSFPTRIDRRQAMLVADPGVLQWLVEQNILVPGSRTKYRLVDEFLRVRLILDVEGGVVESDLMAIGSDAPTMRGKALLDEVVRPFDEEDPSEVDEVTEIEDEEDDESEEDDDQMNPPKPY